MIILYIFIILLVTGCEDKATQQNIIEETVIKYNTALTRAYKKLSFDPLRELTTERQYTRVFSYIMAYADLDQEIEAKLDKIKIERVVIKNNTATVITSESWRYKRLMRQTGKPVTAERMYNYKVEYRLIKDKDSLWKVDEIKILEEEIK